MAHRFAFALILVAATSWSAPAARRPSILFCFSEDCGRYASIYRDPGRPGFNDVINTPALDRIGRAGVVFNNAFVSAPSCTQCAIRASSTAATRSTNRPLWIPTSFCRPRGRGSRSFERPSIYDVPGGNGSAEFIPHQANCRMCAPIRSKTLAQHHVYAE